MWQQVLALVLTLRFPEGTGHILLVLISPAVKVRLYDFRTVLSKTHRRDLIQKYLEDNICLCKAFPQTKILRT